MGVAHMRHVVVSIKIGAAPFVKQVMLPAAHQHDRIAITQHEIIAKIRFATCEHIGLVSRRISGFSIW